MLVVTIAATVPESPPTDDCPARLGKVVPAGGFAHQPNDPGNVCIPHRPLHFHMYPSSLPPTGKRGKRRKKGPGRKAQGINVVGP
jgi:hypothetical protein